MKRKFNTRRIVLFIRLHYYKLFKRGRTFAFNGSVYPYFYHKYNTAWQTERTVEVPIAWKMVQEYADKHVLEVGNVLSHYFEISHDVIDKYEKASAVQNIDVVDFHPAKSFDLIVSISTLEHVGWDEEPKEPLKVLRAISRLTDCLKPGGLMLVTLPLGQNPSLDGMLDQGKIPFSRAYYMKRISKGNDWIQTNWTDIRGSKNNHPFRAANGLVIGIIEKSSLGS